MTCQNFEKALQNENNQKKALIVNEARRQLPVKDNNK